MEGARRPRVLVVEDDLDIATLLTDILGSEGYAPTAVSDLAGLEAQLGQRPDLVILDLRLRRGGAEEIVTSLRNRAMSDVPILLLSAATDLEQRARALGVSEFMAKPFELEDLLAVVRRII